MHTNFSFIIASMNQMNIHYFLLLAYMPWLYFDINLWCFHCPRVKGTCGWKQIYSIHAKFNFFVVLCKLYQDLRVTPWAKPWYNLHNTTKQLKMYRISITKFAHLHPLFSIYHDVLILQSDSLFFRYLFLLFSTFGTHTNYEMLFWVIDNIMGFFKIDFFFRGNYFIFFVEDGVFLTLRYKLKRNIDLAENWYIQYIFDFPTCSKDTIKTSNIDLASGSKYGGGG